VAGGRRWRGGVRERERERGGELCAMLDFKFQFPVCYDIVYRE